MRALCRQFFLSFAILGSVMPLMSVFLAREAGFGLRQIGLSMALTNLPMLVMPALITLLADRRIDPRKILGVAFTISAFVLSGIFLSRGNVAATLTLFVFHGLTFVAMIPLQDGFFFSWAEHRRHLDGETVPYPRVRVWGTVGFILPSILLYFLLRHGHGVSVILPCAAGFCVLSILNSFTLPEVPRAEPSPVAARLPTTEAISRLLSPEARFLCLGLALTYMGTVAYYTFLPIYFQDVIGVAPSHIGLIINLGVLIEVIFTVCMPLLQRRLGLKGIMVIGLTGTTLRMVLLAVFPSVWTAILTQIVHGMEVLATVVAPVMFLDRLAGNRFRNSIQGVFTMMVGGGARIAGSLIGGWVADAPSARHVLLHVRAYPGRHVDSSVLFPVDSRSAERSANGLDSIMKTKISKTPDLVDRERRQAWIGDAVLSLFARQWILREKGRMDGEMLARMTSNQFLSQIGNPTGIEAGIGRRYEEEGLEAAFEDLEKTLVPLFQKQERKREKR